MYATKAGATIAISDVKVPTGKQEELAKADARISELEEQYREGLITDNEKYQQTVDAWNEATENVTKMVESTLDPFGSIYTIAKSGLWAATQMLAQALAPHIRVNAIAPGPVLPSQNQDEASFEREVGATLLKRPVSAEEVTAAIRFLLDTPSITGQMIALDSGQHLACGAGTG